MTGESKQFKYDVFLSHSSKDKPKVRQLAERLRDDGLRVWFDEWEIKPGDDIFLKVEEGLQESRTLILAMSDNAFGSDWVNLERSTALFRDPANKERRFIPLLIGKCEIPDVIKRYRYINWRRESKAAYAELKDSCCSDSTPEAEIDIAKAMPPDNGKMIPLKDKPKVSPHVELMWRESGHTNYVKSVVVLPGGKQAISASWDKTLKLWDISSGKCLATFKGHTNCVISVAVLPDGKQAISASDDGTLKLWDVSSGKRLATFKGHETIVYSVAVLPNGKHAISASWDNTLKLWDISSGKCLATFKGHTNFVNSVAMLPDGKRAISAAWDKTLKLWDISSGKCLATFKGHTNCVNSVTVLPDGKQAISASDDNTLKLWDISSGKCLATFEGHTDEVTSVAVLPDGKKAISASEDNTIRLWHLESGANIVLLEDTGVGSVAVLPTGNGIVVSSDKRVAFYKLTNPNEPATATIEKPTRYTNAKVVLLGDSGVGKSGLSHRLAEDKWVETNSTHGMRVWPLKLPHLPNDPATEREVWLWDLAGQPEYRLTHQLFLDETSLAVVAFDPSYPDDPFKGIDNWTSALSVAVKKNPAKILVAARTDRGGATVTRTKIDRFMEEKGFANYVSTSALTGAGCDELRAAISKHIPWDDISPIVTTRLFKVMKDAVIRLKDEDIVLIRFAELRQRIQMMMPGEVFEDKELKTVIGLLAGEGIIMRLDFGDFVLLKPELLNNYASAVIRVAREHTDGIGCIDENDVLKGNFDFKDMPRLGKEDEEILLRAMVQTFIDQALCIREAGKLVFPSQFNREMPEIPQHPNVLVSYQFTGPLSNIYATLAVKLHYSHPFDKKELWKNAAEFITQEGKIVGFAMEVIGDGIGRIKVFFEEGVPDDTRVVFIKYIHEHLLRNAENVEREREYICPHCDYPVKDKEAVRRRISRGEKDIICADCGKPVPLIDLIEQKFKQDRFQRQVQALDKQANINIDNESRELVLIGHMYQIAGAAGQIYRGYTNSDHGIDGEIEFKDDEGKATAKKVYVQLKSGDSYLYERKHDFHEVFTIKKDRHIKYWQEHAYDVYFVIRTSDSSVRWMNITEYLKTREDKESKQVVFTGEELNEFTLRKLRDKYVYTK